MTRRLALLGVAIAAGALAEHVHAQPFRWTDQHGVTHYSDRRPQPAPGPVEDLNPRAQPEPTRRPAPAPPRPAPEPGPRDSRRPPGPDAPPSTAEATVAKRAAAPAETPSPSETPLFALSRTGQRTDPAARRALEMLDLAGIDRHVDHLARTVRWEIDGLARRTYAPEGLMIAMARAFHRDALAPDLLEAFTHDADAARVDAVLAWYRSPLGRRFSEHRRDPSAADRAAYWTFVRSLPDTAPSPARVALVQRMDRAWRASELEPETARVVRRTLQRIVARRAQPRPDRQPREEDPVAGDEHRRFQIVTWTLYRYETFTEDDLRRYVEFLESAAGTWFTRTVRDGLHASLAAAERRAAASLPPRG